MARMSLKSQNRCVYLLACSRFFSTASSFSTGTKVIPLSGRCPVFHPSALPADMFLRYPYSTSKSKQSNTVVMIHDAFQSTSYWNGYMPGPHYQGVILDRHIYQMFSVAVGPRADMFCIVLLTVNVSQENERSSSQHIQVACEKADDLSSSTMWEVVGEWTPAANDCAKYLNGRGIGSRYDGTYPGSSFIGSCSGLTGSASSFSASYKTYLRQFWEAQVISYEKGQGWIQWTWKTEAGTGEEWSYKAGLANGCRNDWTGICRGYYDDRLTWRRTKTIRCPPGHTDFLRDEE